MRRKTVDMDKVLKNSDIIQPINVEHLMEPAEEKLKPLKPDLISVSSASAVVLPSCSAKIPSILEFLA